MSEIGMSVTMATVFGAPLFAVLKPDDRAKKLEFTVPKKSRIILNLTAVFGALLAFFILSALFGSGMALPRFTPAEWDLKMLLAIIPLSIVGIIMGYLYFFANKLFTLIEEKLKKFPWLKAVLCGLALGFCGCFLPLTLFSGEEQMFEVIAEFNGIGAFILILTGLIKLVVCPMCVHLGWRGGNIFPIIFAGVNVGYAFSLLFPIDPVFSVIIVTASLTAAVMKKPVMVIALLLLCFSPQDILIMGIAAVIGSLIYFPKKKKT
jgi:H+/Cl- antiporter ClcA